jgi:hypothetical protein
MDECASLSGGTCVCPHYKHQGADHGDARQPWSGRQPSSGRVHCPDPGRHPRHWHVLDGYGVHYEGWCSGEPLVDRTPTVEAERSLWRRDRPDREPPPPLSEC